jgi:hypothetical protein
MAFIKDPDWYLMNQSTPDKIYTNAVFFALALYHLLHDNVLLGSLFALLGIGSAAFHISTSKETLLLDRLAMILVFSYFFNLFYPSVSFLTYSLIGAASVLLWYGFSGSRFPLGNEAVVECHLSNRKGCNQCD